MLVPLDIKLPHKLYSRLAWLPSYCPELKKYVVINLQQNAERHTQQRENGMNGWSSEFSLPSLKMLKSIIMAFQGCVDKP